MSVRIIGKGQNNEEYTQCKGCGMILGYTSIDKHGVRTSNLFSPVLTVICPNCGDERIVDQLCFCKLCSSRQEDERGKAA